MHDLFATAAAPAPGSLTPSEERGLHKTDVARWRKYAAPTLAKRLLEGAPSDVILSWSLMTDDYRRNVWAQWSKSERERIRAVLNTREMETAQ